MGAEDKKRGRKVRFHGRVQFKTIRHVTEFSDDEIVAGWYRKKDFMRMSEEVSEIAQMVAQGTESHKGEELCIRGLEHLVEEDVADYRAEKMIASIDAVLDEQDQQRDEEIEDAATIASIYTEIVSPLLREAYLVGLRDAKEATAAAEQMPDLPPPEVAETIPDVPVEEKPAEEAVEVEAEPQDKGHVETTTLNDAEEEKKAAKEAARAAARAKAGKLLGNGAKLPTVPKPKPKAAPRKKREKGAASEMSPFTRTRDGKVVFRNKDVELAKKELSKQRRTAVRDALFKFLDD
mmetsp:Transcript_84063/g.126012  ORF Transcript_84063/g.126012 Transcript_84063/m.126012 type:complete len:292 (-) Transcript_84063:223-1098(-)|eukprot:CAMPEP_0117029640 /NCGR_PEP_ID=MMETSP0472-20121206/21446_1 /TAXON_ID=693140 ORGANISM="Tiarina fusus, Strain LIS" /NCGR_SAMPLE_ID=MMETSP0472 /ASSEMBLY_ACC=CAM_ASM_000603 /LENGTH=291 /DNA_ID=CAMNT_0004737463 /DNA_START=289 /DNA_END=1164 /DNA_ORIENTATION=-